MSRPDSRDAGAPDGLERFLREQDARPALRFLTCGRDRKSVV